MVDCELKVAVDGDEIELELKWSMVARASAEETQDWSEADESAEYGWQWPR